MTVSRVDRLTSRIAQMDRPALVKALRGLRCDFEIDFTDEYLNSISLTRLRHIFLAAMMHSDNPKWRL